MMKLLFLSYFLFFGFVSFTQPIRIGLFTGSKLKEIKLQVGQGTYMLEVEAENATETSFLLLNSLDTYLINSHNGLVQIFSKGQLLLQGATLLLTQKNQEDFCNFSPLSPSLKMRSYEGDFELKMNKGELRIINILDLETYLEGVVSSEGGNGQKLAYYEAQAVISRTYALSNLNRHQNENFSLCESVHCQAYLSKRTGSVGIDSAVLHTKGYILLDDASHYYPTFFHANCGGQTCEPQTIWNEPIKGLQSFQDTFCIHTKQAHWVKSIPLQQWTDFLTEKYNFPIQDSMSYSLLQSFRQDHRKAFYLHPIYGIPLRDLREKFKLKSTFFDAVVVGQEMMLYGKGFGHGVGLCQEGAMQMAKKGYSFDQILKFYYPGATLTK